MTKVEILKETKEYYEVDPKNRRAYSWGNCRYFLRNGDGDEVMCGVGRCMLDPEKYKDELYGVIDVENLDESLKQEYRGHCLDFWIDIQLFHDREDNWYERGISPTGENHFYELLAKYEKL